MWHITAVRTKSFLFNRLSAEWKNTTVVEEAGSWRGPGNNRKSQNSTRRRVEEGKLGRRNSRAFRRAKFLFLLIRYFPKNFQKFSRESQDTPSVIFI
jgi:hypothetical protein